jgi:hypothetical protein
MLEFILKTRATGSQQIWRCWAPVSREEIRSQDENIHSTEKSPKHFTGEKTQDEMIFM